MYAMNSFKDVIPGVYQHYKGKSYLVFVNVSHTETKERMVVYSSTSTDGTLWTRPAAMFLDEVEIDGKRLPRFSFLRPLYHSEKPVSYTHLTLPTKA